jgi:hypothetical protein
MSDDIPPQPTAYTEAQRDPLVALLGDLQHLSGYLHSRSKRTFENAQQFALHARKNADSRVYDERQATMLEYQHQIWNEIAGLVDRLAQRYTEIAHDQNDEDGTEH